jgi:hypothetical protein
LEAKADIYKTSVNTEKPLAAIVSGDAVNKRAFTVTQPGATTW